MSDSETKNSQQPPPAAYGTPAGASGPYQPGPSQIQGQPGGPQMAYVAPPPGAYPMHQGPAGQPVMIQQGPGGQPVMMQQGPGGQPIMMQQGPGGQPVKMQQGPGGQPFMMQQGPGGQPFIMQQGPGGQPFIMQQGPNGQPVMMVPYPQGPGQPLYIQQMQRTAAGYNQGTCTCGGDLGSAHWTIVAWVLCICFCPFNFCYPCCMPMTRNCKSCGKEYYSD